MILSVIIPIFKTEKYLSDCLESVCSQDLDDMEIICVNDGSPDRSADIVREWQTRDPRIRLIVQENQGISCARNAGLQIATGEYVYFLDSDDRLSGKEVLRSCSEQMTADILDVLCASATVFYDPPELEGKVLTSQHTLFSLKQSYPGVFAGADLIELMRQNVDWCAAVSTKMFRREFLIRNKLAFIPGQIHEDEYYSFCSVFLAERAGVHADPIFERRVREESIMTSEVSYRYAYGDTVNMAKILRFMETHRDIHDIDPVIGTTVIHSRKRAVSTLQDLSKEQQDLYREELSPDLEFYYKAFIEDEVFFRKRAHSFEKSLSIKEKQLEFKEKQLRSKDEWISKFKESLEFREKQLKSKDEWISKLKEGLEFKTKKITDLENKLQSANEKADDLRNKLELEKENRRALQKKADRIWLNSQKLNQELTDIKQSGSYRIGRVISWPVRFLRKIIRIIKDTT